MKFYSVSFTALVFGVIGLSLSLPELGNNVNPLSREGRATNVSAKPMGASWSGSWPANSGYHAYGGYFIDATGIPNGGSMTITFSAQNTPNRFYFQDNCGLGDWSVSNPNLNGYVGDATYPGPWGMSMNTYSGGQIGLSKRNGCNSYKMTVETATGPDNDQWTAIASY